MARFWRWFWRSLTLVRNALWSLCRWSLARVSKSRLVSLSNPEPAVLPPSHLHQRCPESVMLLSQPVAPIVPYRPTVALWTNRGLRRVGFLSLPREMSVSAIGEWLESCHHLPATDEDLEQVADYHARSCPLGRTVAVSSVKVAVDEVRCIWRGRPYTGELMFAAVSTPRESDYGELRINRFVFPRRATFAQGEYVLILEW